MDSLGRVELPGTRCRHGEVLVAKDDDFTLPFSPMTIAGLGVGFLALRAFFGGQGQAPAPQQPAPAGGGVQGMPSVPPGYQVVDDATGQTVAINGHGGMGGMGGGLMGYDGNGIPVVQLPRESAQRSAQIQGMRPTIPGITPQGRGSAVQGQAAPGNAASPQSSASGAEKYAGETFGGNEGMGGFGGENF